MLESATRRYAVDDVVAFVGRVFATSGMPAADAQRAAALMVETDCYGLGTHGVMRVPLYLERLQAGDFNPRPQYRWTQLGPSAWHFDADGGIGSLVSTDCLERLCEEAAGKGVALAVIADAGHLGGLGVYVRHVAERGMMGMLMQSTSPAVAPPGAARGAIGNNPLAFAAPRPDGPPLVIDFAQSIVARGKILQAAVDGREIPADWAVGPDGAPTTDPRAAIDGALRPSGGYKGIALSMIVELLAGVLTGYSSSVSAAKTGRAAVSGGHNGAFAMVFDPAVLAGSEDAFAQRMLAWLDVFREFAGDAAHLPGERGARLYEERMRDGLVIPPAVLAELRAVAERTGVPFTLD